MTPFQLVRSRAAWLDADDVDTDQIIPARFLKGTTKEGLGAHLLADRGGPPWDPSDEPPRVLVTGANFGCGSSREHAAWALVGAGVRVVLARSFADIFRQNAVQNGLLAAQLDGAGHARLTATIAKDPACVLTVDLEAQIVRSDGPHDALSVGSGSAIGFTIDPFDRDCLLTGRDELGYLLSIAPQIDAYEARRPRAPKETT